MTIWIIDGPSYCQYEGIHKKTKKVNEDLVEKNSKEFF